MCNGTIEKITQRKAVFFFVKVTENGKTTFHCENNKKKKAGKLEENKIHVRPIRVKFVQCLFVLAVSFQVFINLSAVSILQKGKQCSKSAQERFLKKGS